MRFSRSIRLYRSDDREACEGIYLANERRGLVPMGYRSDFLAGLGTGSARTFCIEEEGRIVACGSVMTCRARPCARQSVYSILTYGIVHPESQRTGLGRLLLRVRIAAMPIAEAGPHELHLFATTTSTSYYSKCGFHARENQLDELGAILIPMFQTVDAACQRENVEALQADGIDPLPEWACVPSIPSGSEKYFIRTERGILTDIIASIWNEEVSLQVRRVCAGFSVMQSWASLAVSRSRRRQERYQSALLHDGERRPQGVIRPARGRAISVEFEGRIRGVGALTIECVPAANSGAVRLEARGADGEVLGWLETRPDDSRLAEFSFDWKMPLGAMFCLAVQMSRRAWELGRGRG